MNCNDNFRFEFDPLRYVIGIISNWNFTSVFVFFFHFSISTAYIKIRAIFVSRFNEVELVKHIYLHIRRKILHFEVLTTSRFKDYVYSLCNLKYQKSV